jgi:hypothetical protein
MWVNRKTNLVERWSYRLQDFKPEDAEVVWEWKDWARFGDILLSTTRYNAAQNRTIKLEAIEINKDIPDSVFTSPDRLVPAK